MEADSIAFVSRMASPRRRSLSVPQVRLGRNGKMLSGRDTHSSFTSKMHVQRPESYHTYLRIVCEPTAPRNQNHYVCAGQRAATKLNVHSQQLPKLLMLQRSKSTLIAPPLLNSQLLKDVCYWRRQRNDTKTHASLSKPFPAVSQLYNSYSMLVPLILPCSKPLAPLQPSSQRPLIARVGSMTSSTTPVYNCVFARGVSFSTQLLSSSPRASRTV